jgi:hypothetical protein
MRSNRLGYRPIADFPRREQYPRAPGWGPEATRLFAGLCVEVQDDVRPGQRQLVEVNTEFWPIDFRVPVEHPLVIWAQHGACIGHDPRLWDARPDIEGLSAGQATTQALGICKTCPVRQQCQSWGVHHEETGTWGMTTESTRRPAPPAEPGWLEQRLARESEQRRLAQLDRDHRARKRQENAAREASRRRQIVDLDLDRFRYTSDGTPLKASPAYTEALERKRQRLEREAAADRTDDGEE